MNIGDIPNKFVNRFSTFKYDPFKDPLSNAKRLVGVDKIIDKGTEAVAPITKELIVRPLAKLGVTGAAPVISAYKSIKGDVAGADQAIDQGFNIPGLGQVRPVGGRSDEEIAQGKLYGSTGRNLAEIGATGVQVASLHPAAFGYGGATKLAAETASVGQKAIGALPTLAERFIPKSTTLKTAIGRLGVQGGVDATIGAAQSAASDIVQGKTDIKDIARRAGLSGIFSAALPLAVGSVSGIVKGTARQFGQGRSKVDALKNIASTVGEETGLLTKSIQSIKDTGNFGRRVRQSLKQKEEELSTRIAQAEGHVPADISIPGTTLTVEGRYSPLATRSEASGVDKVKLQAVQKARDFTKNWIDDRAPLTINFAGEAKMAGATDDEINALTSSVNDVRTADSKAFSRLNKVREQTDAIRPKNMGEGDFDALVNKYSIAKSEAETVRDSDILQKKAQADVAAIESSLDPETLAAVQQAHDVNVRQFNDEILQSQVDSGMISAETAAKYRAEKPNYTKFIVEEKLPVDSDTLRGIGSARRGDVKGAKDAARVKELTEDLAKLPAKEANAVGAIVAERQNAKNIQATRAVDLDQKYGTGTFTPVWTEADEAAKQALIKKQMELGDEKQALLDQAAEKLKEIRKERTERNALETFRKGAKNEIASDIEQMEDAVQTVKQVTGEEMKEVNVKINTAKEAVSNERKVNAEKNKFVKHVKSVIASLKKDGSISPEDIANLRALRDTRGPDTTGLDDLISTLETAMSSKAPQKERLNMARQMANIVEGSSSKVESRFNALLKNAQAAKNSAIDDLNQVRKGLADSIGRLSQERKDISFKLSELNKKKDSLEGAETITLRRNGVEEYYKVNDRQVADFFRGKDKETSQIVQIASKAANWTRQFATGANPAFAATNAIRDYATARDMLATQGITLTAGDWLDGLKAGRSIIYKKQGSKLSPLANEAFELGGLLHSMSTSARSTQDIGTAVSNLSKKESTVLSRLEDWNNQTELATRIAVLQAAKRKGITDKNVLRSLVRDSTVDFQVSGETMREWNKIIPFMNARLQGLRNVVKRMAEDPAKSTRVAQLYTNFAQTLIDAQNARYGDVVNRLNPTERQDNYVIVLGKYDDNGQTQPLYVRIPKGSIGQMAGMVKDAVEPQPGDTRSAKERTEDFFIGLTRLSPIQGLPSIGGSFFETWKGLSSNKDWRNYNIVPEYLNKPGVSPLIQKTKTTSESVTAAVDALNKATGGTDTTEGKIALSPAKTEFAIRSLFSGVGNQAVAVGDMAYNLATKGSPVPSNIPDGSALGVMSKLPIFSSFVRSKGISTDPQVEKKNIEASRAMSLVQGREKEAAQSFLEKVKNTPREERKKLIDENPELAKQAMEQMKDRSFIEGVNPNDSLANQGVQLYNALESKKTPEEKKDLLDRIQKFKATSPNGVVYAQAYAFVNKLKGLSKEERIPILQKAKAAGLLDNEKFLEAAKLYGKIN